MIFCAPPLFKFQLMFGTTASFPMKQRESPRYLELLNAEDLAKFRVLQQTLSSQACRNCRNKRVETFGEMLTVVRLFCMRNDDDDWKRCLACGVCWYQQYLCINIRQFHLLIDKCKSSINGSLHRLSFVMIPNRVHCMNIIGDAIPYLKEHPSEAREWSVREFQRSFRPQQVFQIPVPYAGNSFCYSAPVVACESERREYPCPKIAVEPTVKSALESEPEVDVPMITEPERLLDDADWMFNDDGVIF